MQQGAATSFVTTTHDDLKALAGRISTVDPLAAQRMTMLSDALVNPTSSASPSAISWASGDVHEIIDIDTVTERARGQGSNRIISLLEWLRNGLIILPLALTWFGISQAVSAYHALLQADTNEATQPFIFLWEQGFKGRLSPFLTLSSLALGDFILLCIIIILTFIISWRQSITENSREQAAARLRSELADGLARAALCLAEKKLNQPTDFASVIMRLDHVSQQTAARLDSVAQQMGTMVQQFLTELQEERKQRGDYNTFLRGLETITNDMLSGATAIQQATATLTTSLDALTIPVKEIPVQQQVLLQNAQDILAQFGPITNDLRQLVTEQQTQGQNLQQTLTDSLQQLLAEQKQAHQNMLTDQHSFNSAFYDMLSQSLGQLLTQQNQSSRELTDTVDTLNASQAQMLQLIQQIQMATAHQQQLIQTIENEHKSQIAMTYHIRDAANEMKEALKAVQLITPELRSITVDMSKFVSALRSIPLDLKTELFDPLRHYSNAADNVSKGADRMVNAAAIMQQAGQDLQSAAARLHVPPNGQQPI